MTGSKKNNPIATGAFCAFRNKKRVVCFYEPVIFQKDVFWASPSTRNWIACQVHWFRGVDELAVVLGVHSSVIRVNQSIYKALNDALCARTSSTCTRQLRLLDACGEAHVLISLVKRTERTQPSARQIKMCIEEIKKKCKNFKYQTHCRTFPSPRHTHTHSNSPHRKSMFMHPSLNSNLGSTLVPTFGCAYLRKKQCRRIAITRQHALCRE